MRLTVGLLLAAGCGDKFIETIHGGGGVVIDVVPTGVFGVTLHGEATGATAAEVAAGDWTCGSTLQETETRREGPQGAVLDLCLDAVPVDGITCFDNAVIAIVVETVVDGTPPLPVFRFTNVDGVETDDDAVDGWPDTTVWKIPPDGSWQGIITVEDPCVGPGPMEHQVDLSWAFDESHTVETRLPWIAGLNLLD